VAWVGWMAQHQQRGKNQGANSMLEAVGNATRFGTSQNKRQGETGKNMGTTSLKPEALDTTGGWHKTLQYPRTSKEKKQLKQVGFKKKSVS